MRVPGLGRAILRLAGGLLVISLVVWGEQVRAQTPTPAAGPTQANEPPTADDICRTVEQAAAQNELPVEFFARVIWQESRFNAAAVSPKGAEGIAQFMPQTADFRGLADPFDPLTALHHAASYLNELRNKFGNLGLAAASYNAGPGRVSAWLGGQRDLPNETRNYVAVITGWTADEWASSSPPQTSETTIPRGVPCTRLANLILAEPKEAQRIAAYVPVWGAQLASLAANMSERSAWAIYRTVQKRYAALVGDREPILLRDRIPGMGTVQRYVIRIAADSREDLERLCGKIITSGGGCAVLRNRPAVQVVNVN
jgi:Transglycosylase SLT domain